jgi:hypothetical protein
MDEMPLRRFSWKDHVLAPFSSILFISQIVVGIYLLSEISQNEILAYVGVGLYVFSGMVFGALPVFEFRKKRKSEKGKVMFIPLDWPTLEYTPLFAIHST